MQLQVECNSLAGKQQSCCLCTRSFEMKEARVILCNEQGTNCGEVCPECLGKGFNWLNQRFEQLSKPQKTVRNARSVRQDTLIKV